MRHLFKETQIYGISSAVYLPLFILAAAAMHFGKIPGGMAGTLLVLMMFGGLFQFAGDRIPIVRSFLGGGTFVCIFGAAAMKTAGIIPAETAAGIDAFLNETGFLEFFITALIAGSVLSMERRLLIRSAVRFLPVAFAAIACGIAAVAAVGALLGIEPKETIMFIAMPMMSGGMGAGVIPLSGIYAEYLGTEPSLIISRLIPASTIGNVAAILMASLLNILGDHFPGLSGGGRLMREEDGKEKAAAADGADFAVLGTGLLISLAFYFMGILMHAAVPDIHVYAWMIILTAAAKVSGVIPRNLEDAAGSWSRFVIKIWTPAVLIGIGAALIDLESIRSALAPSYLLFIGVITAGVSFGAAAVGKLAGFFPVESAITAGLCTINMGGSGNIAILSASKRMELLAFAQLATRICGSLVLVLSGLLMRVFF